VTGGTALYYAWAAPSTKTWDFGTASDYTVYKGDGTEDTANEKIEVADGMARLVAQTQTYSDDTAADYNAGSFTNTRTQGQEVKLILSKTGTTYNTPGTFTSRVFDGGAGNQWVRLKANVDSRLNKSGMVWTRVNGSQTASSVITGSNEPTHGWFNDYSSYSPSVIKDGSTYKMWFTGDNPWVAGWRTFLGYATSPDGIDWTVYDGPQTDHSVMVLGGTGTFDFEAVLQPTVIKDDSTYKMWYTGSATLNNVHHYRIGYATSTDGIVWTRVAGSGTGGSVIDVGTPYRAPDDDLGDPGYVGDLDSTYAWSPTVIKDGSTYKMWYSGHDGSLWSIGYATSTDGVSWTKVRGPYEKGSVIAPGMNGFDMSHVSYPCVIKEGSIYKMWYSGYGYGVASWATGWGNRVGYATSYDGINWAQVAGPNQGGSVLNGSTDGNRFDYNSPDKFSVIKEDDTYKAWYSGSNSYRRIGYATSAPDTTLPTSVLFQVRSGTGPSLSGIFVGPDGTADTYYIVDNYFPVRPTAGGPETNGYWYTFVPRHSKNVRLKTAGNFNTSHRYVQYQVTLNGVSGGSGTPPLTPYVDWVAFVGTQATKFDDTLGDFNQGTYNSNTITTFQNDNTAGFVGLAKNADGGTSSNGEYTSKVFDGGADAEWKSVSWSKGGQAIEPPEPGLVGLYHLDGNLTDSSGYGGDGTVEGSATYDTINKKFGSGCWKYSTGSSGNDFLLDSAALRDFESMTISLWVYFDNASEDGGYAVSLYDNRSPRNNLILRIAPTDQNGYMWDNGAGGLGLEGSQVKIGYKQWHHVVWAWDGNRGPSSFRFYVDGVKVCNAYDSADANSFFEMKYFERPMMVGGHYWGTPYPFKGSIDELAIYNRPLSDDEIMRQYRRGSEIKFQCRSGDTNPPTGGFVGPNGTTSTFYSTAAGSTFSTEIPAGRYFQYRAYLYGSGKSTPSLDSVTLAYNSATFTDDTRAKFDSGTYGAGTKWYTDEVRLVKNPEPGVGISPISASTSGLVALYHMDGNWLDATLAGHHGINHGAGFSGEAVLGTNAGNFIDNPYVDLGTLDIPGSTTVEFWYKIAAPQGNTIFLSDYKDSTAKQQMSIWLGWPNNNLFWTQNHTDGSYSQCGMYQPYKGNHFGKWQHCAVVRDDAAKLQKIYLDGKLEGTLSYAGKTVVSGATAGSDVMGRYGDYNAYHHMGLIDELAIYSRALTSEEIAQHAGMAYPTQGTNIFTSQTIDAGQSAVWNSIDWGEVTRGYGNQLALPSQGSEIPTDTPGLLDLWHFDGGWNDSKGVLNGTAEGDATFDTSNQVLGSGCATFDGTGDKVDFSGEVSPQVKTVEFWVKSGGFPEGVSVMGLLELIANTSYVSLIKQTGAYVSTTGFVNTGVTPNTYPIIYINGEPALNYVAPNQPTTGGAISDGWTHVAIVTTSAISSSGIKIGMANNVFFNGKMDELALYNRSLTPSEIKEHYLKGRGNSHILAMWHMDGDWTDATGKGHDGTASGATFDASGKFGSCGYFDGSSSVSFPDAGLPSGTSSRTIEMWVKTTQAGYPYFLNYGTKPDDEFDMNEIFLGMTMSEYGANKFPWGNFTNTKQQYAFLAGAQEAGYSGDVSTDYAASCDVRPINDGKWHHLALTIHNPNPVSFHGIYFTLYVDGENRNNATWQDPQGVRFLDTILTGTGKLGDGTTGGFPYTGYLDEVAIYNTVLSGDEIKDRYLRGATDLRMQVSKDGTTWTDASGAVGQYIDTTPSSLALGSSSQTLKYKALFSTTDGFNTPIMEGMDLATVVYDSACPYVIPDTGQAYLGYLTSYAQTLGPDNQGAVKYQISKDGSTWYYWNGSAWATTTQGYIASNTAADINTNIGTFYEQSGAGTFKFKAFLYSSGLQATELDKVDLGYAQGRITITAPNGGENLLYGSYADVTWTASGTVSDTWKIEYSKNSGSTWTTIVASEAVTPVGGIYTYRWDPIPLAAVSTSARIQVTDATDGSIHDMSNANLTIGTGFEIISPNGGEKVYAGSQNNTIQWKSSGGMGAAVDLYYSVNGTDYTSIATGVANQTGTNSYTDWDILLDESMYTESAKVKVRSEGADKEDTSNAAFTIAGISITEPDTGDLVRIGATYAIQWKSGGAGSTVKIEYSTNGGTGWATAAANAPNTGGDNSYDWAVDPGLSPTAVAKIKITSNSDGNLVAESGLFTLGKLQITAPNGSEVWQAKKGNATVTWTSAGFSGTVSLKYSTNGTDWTDIAAALTNDGSYTGAEGFIVPDVLSDTAKFKIVSDADPTFADTSDNNFSIAGVKVTAPNGGESFSYTSNNNITWDDNNAGETATLYYSIDGGSTWPGTIASSVLQGTYSWRPSLTAGVVPTVRGMVKVVADNPEGDANPPDPYTAPMDDPSNANFTIAGLKVSAPAQGANWLIGSTQGVQWLSAGTSSATATVYYSVIGDFSDQVAIATNIANNEVYPGNNTYQWPIGSSITPSITAKVKVVAGAYNATSGAFTLKGIRVTAPVLGATITQGVASNVTWSSAGVSGNVNIYYSSDSGSNYNATPINASPINVTTGTYSWTPNILVYTPSETAKLKVEVVSGADTGMSAESPVFTLKGIKISAPTTGTIWDLGSTNSITWTAAGAGATCNIYYASDGTNFGDPINASAILLSAGTYSWAIPSTTMPSNGTAKIKITSDTSVSSASYAFTVKGIKVTYPIATTMWELNAPVTMTWVGVGTGGTYDVYYVIDGAETKINTIAVSGQSFDWTVTSGAVSNSVIIRIKDLGPSAYVGDSQPFKIVGEATVTINTPASTDKWKVSDTDAITWTRSGSAEKTFTVEYDDNPAFSSPESISGTPAYDGAGHYTLMWAMPDSVGTRYIRVTDIDNPTITDTSDAFKILPKFRVNTPDGGNIFFALKPGTTVNWGTTGTAGTVDLYYSTDTPLFETWTKINSSPVTDNGSGLIEAITALPNGWTVANVQSTNVKFKVQAANANLSDAYDVSDAVFTIKYYDVTWNVKSATTGIPLDKLFVIDSSGWAEADLSSPINHTYPYGTYNTNWSRADYFDKAERGWTTDSDNKSFIIVMSESSLAPEYHVMSNFSYDASLDKFLINSWVERGGVILAKPTSCTVHIYNAVGGPLQTLTSAGSDTNGVFWQEWPTTNLDQNAMYFAKVDVIYSGETYSSGLAYSLNIPKSIAGLGPAVASQLANLQTAIGVDLGAQTTDIKKSIGNLETSIGVNLDAKINTVQIDIASVKTVVDNIEAKVGVIAGTGSTVSLSDQIAQNLATELAKGVQAEILTRPTSAAFGTATDIRFRTGSGRSPTITVYDANNTTRVASAAMKEVGTTGIYEYSLTPQSAWGAGEYTIVCEEATKKAIDSMVLSVSESVATGSGTDEGMVNSINATVTTIDANVKTMLSKVNTIPTDTTDVNTSVASLMAAMGKTSDAAGTNSLFGKIASAQGDLTAFKTDITSYVDGVETTLGTTSDIAGTSTVYGKIKSLEQTLSTLGPDGAKASKELIAAKDKAAAAVKAAEDIKKMIASGGKNAEAYSALQKLAGDLAKLQAANANIGSSVTADSITSFIKETRAKLAQVAMKEGYENLVPSTGEVGEVNLTDETEVEDLRNNMTELKALLSQVRSLLDKQVNAPVVKSWIEGK
jgi:predicted GH43/DUF377 family glycosyl hydrolase